MSRRISSSDRSALIRLAASLPNGDGTRRAILAGLSKTSAPTTLSDLGLSKRDADKLREATIDVAASELRRLWDSGSWEYEVEGEGRGSIDYGDEPELKHDVWVDDAPTEIWARRVLPIDLNKLAPTILQKANLPRNVVQAIESKGADYLTDALAGIVEGYDEDKMAKFLPENEVDFDGQFDYVKGGPHGYPDYEVKAITEPSEFSFELWHTKNGVVYFQAGGGSSIHYVLD